MKKEEIYDLAIEKNGADTQKIVCIEEMSELTKELTKDIRGRGNRKCISEELADVQIMIEQMIRFYNCQDLIKGIKDKKLIRLENRLTEVEK